MQTPVNFRKVWLEILFKLVSLLSLTFAPLRIMFKVKQEVGGLSTLSSARRARTQAMRTRPSTRPARGILVVDDEITIRSLLDTALTREGYPVWLASDGEQALEVF